MAKRKTLEEAIGCWTVDDSSFKTRHQLIGQSLRVCKVFTKQDQPPERLLEELILLQRRIASLDEVVRHAIVRCSTIMNTKECAK